MSQLPSPRTAIQVAREILINGINVMDDDELIQLHKIAGPFCLEALLNATQPGQPPAAPPPAPKPQRKPPPPTLLKKESQELRSQLRQALEEAGSCDRLSMVSLGLHPRTADGLLGDSPQYRMPEHTADLVKAIIANLGEGSDDE